MATCRTVVPYEQRKLAMLLNYRLYTAFIMSIFRTLHDYLGRTGVSAARSVGLIGFQFWLCLHTNGILAKSTTQSYAGINP